MRRASSNALTARSQKARSIPGLRGISVENPEEAPPSVSLKVTFAYDSATLTDDARRALVQLAQALKDSRLADQRFEIAGHTDAAGTQEYNQKLSQSRAEAVKAYLIREAGVSAERLDARGFGFSKLARPDDPRSEDNRRVEVTRLGG